MQDRGARSGDVRRLWDSLGTLLFVLIATVVYFVIPVPGQMRESSWWVLFGVGLLVLALLIMVRIRTLLRASADARARGLIVVLVCAVLFFAWADDALAVLPGQYVDLHTKTDAIYFCVSTLATVGFGDVHAAGQAARAAETLQVLFNIIFLGTAVTFVTGILRQRAQTRGQQAAHSGNGDVPDSGPGPAGGAS